MFHVKERLGVIVTTIVKSPLSGVASGCYNYCQIVAVGCGCWLLQLLSNRHCRVWPLVVTTIVKSKCGFCRWLGRLPAVHKCQMRVRQLLTMTPMQRALVPSSHMRGSLSIKCMGVTAKPST